MAFLSLSEYYGLSCLEPIRETEQERQREREKGRERERDTCGRIMPKIVERCSIGHHEWELFDSNMHCFRDRIGNVLEMEPGYKWTNLFRRCPWCNGYSRRKWTRWHEFRSWTILIAFHIALIPLGKVWIQLFSLQLWVNSRAD